MAWRADVRWRAGDVVAMGGDEVREQAGGAGAGAVGGEGDVARLMDRVVRWWVRDR